MHPYRLANVDLNIWPFFVHISQISTETVRSPNRSRVENCLSLTDFADILTNCFQIRYHFIQNIATV